MFSASLSAGLQDTNRRRKRQHGCVQLLGRCGVGGQLKEHWTRSPETQMRESTNNNNNNNNNRMLVCLLRAYYVPGMVGTSDAPSPLKKKFSTVPNLQKGK